MQVKVNVHESKVEDIQPGMRAHIRILDREWQGTVTSIGNQPEPTGFFSANVKEYATTVRIDGEPQGLRPGMTAEVEILVAHLKNVLTLPVASIVQQRDGFYCWLDMPQGPERRPLVLGRSNDQFVEVQDGVAEGDRVLLNPRSTVAEARAMDDIDDEVDVTGRFGAPTEVPAAPRGNGPPANAPADTGDRGPTGGERRGPPTDRAGRGGPAGGGDLMRLDQDGDGRISREEAPEQMGAFFDRMDANGDGFVDREEMEALRRRFEAGGGPGGPGGPRPPGGPEEARGPGGRGDSEGRPGP
jgi:HlyD family secretion protein